MSSEHSVEGIDSSDRADASSALSGAARSSALSFVGAMASGLAGLGLSLIMGRSLGPSGSGLIFQMISVFTIAGAIAKLGLDTTCVWILPRLAIDHPSDVRRASSIMIAGSLLGGTAAGLAVVLIAQLFESGNSDLRFLLEVSAAFMPIASVCTVALAATRGIGGIRPYVLIGSIGLPTLRLAAIAVAVSFAASALIVGMIWLLVLLIAALLALGALHSMLRRFAPSNASTRPAREITRQITHYSLKRAASSVVEQALLWQDVLIVGLIAGPAAAGVYGVVSRLVQAGFIPSTSMRIVVSPQFSRMMHQERIAELNEFYTRTAQWIVLTSVPMYVILSVQAHPILGIFGNGFQDGAIPLAILCIGATIWSSAGNVQSLLLMSGRSGWAALIKVIVLITSLSLLLTLVPKWGIYGAASAWTISMTLDALLAVILVHRGTGIRLDLRAIFSALLFAGLSTAIPAVLTRIFLGETLVSLFVGTAIAGIVYVVVLYLARERFALHHATAIFIRRQRRPQ